MRDGTLTQQEFFDRMNASERLPTTSQPAVGAFVEAYEAALSTASHVVSVHISSKLSGTMAAALQAAERFAGRVRVVDSLNLSWGLGLQVLEAAKAASAGADVDAIVERVERARDRVRLVVGLDSLDNLVKGGRIPKIAGAVGGVLNVKVLIACRADGTLGLVRPVRGVRSALEHTVKWVEEQMGGATRGAFCVMHALSEERAKWVSEQIGERFEAIESYFVETGTVIAAHTGTGWGVAFLPEE